MEAQNPTSQRLRMLIPVKRLTVPPVFVKIEIRDWSDRIAKLSMVLYGPLLLEGILNRNPTFLLFPQLPLLFKDMAPLLALALA